MQQAKIVDGRVKNKIDTAENWYNLNPLLLAGEIGIEDGTGLFKFGNGRNRWRDLPYKNFMDIQTVEPSEESTDLQVTSAKRLFQMLGGRVGELTSDEKQIIPAINGISDWINFADDQLSDILYSYEGFIYEVGTFHPRFFGTTRAGEINYIERTGEYVILGRIIGIVIHVIMTYTTATGPTGEIRVNDWPMIPDLANVQSGLSARSSMSDSSLTTIMTPAFTRFQFTQPNGTLANLNWPATLAANGIEFTISGLYGVRR